jgi:hypothetical protein
MTMKKLIMAAVAVPLALGLAAGPAIADPGTSVPRVVHADGAWTYKDGHTETHSSDVGVIIRPVDGAITLLRADGATVSNALPSDACVRVSGMPATVADLHFGMRALVISQVTADGTSIRVVRAGFPLVRLDQPGCGLFEGAVHGDVTFTFADGTTRAFSFGRRAIAAATDGEVSMQGLSDAAIAASTTRIVVRHHLTERAARRALVVSERIGDALRGKLSRLAA